MLCGTYEPAKQEPAIGFWQAWVARLNREKHRMPTGFEFQISNAFFFFFSISKQHVGFPGGSDGKESTCNAGDPGSVPFPHTHTHT